MPTLTKVFVYSHFEHDETADTAKKTRNAGREHAGRVFWQSLCPIVVMLGLACQACADEPTDSSLKRYRFQRIRMGVPWELQFYATDDQWAIDAAERAFARVKQLDQSLSDYDPDSEVRRLCRDSRPGAPVVVSQELFDVLQFSLELSRQSQGAFDVTVGPLTELWRKAWRKRAFPEAKLLQEALGRVGYQSLRLHEKSRAVELLLPEMRIDLGAIAKGYAADVALRELQAAGITRALVDASGDLVAGDPPPGRAEWVISIEPLKSRENLSSQDRPIEHLRLKHASVATSGDANRYVEIEGIRYSHLVDPNTGLGLTVPSSVTVIAPNGMIADALASAVSVLGPERGFALLKQHRAQALVMTGSPQGIQTCETSGYCQYRIQPPAE